MTTFESYAVWNRSNADWQSVPDIVPSVPIAGQAWTYADAAHCLDVDAADYAAEGFYNSITEALDDMEVREYPL